MVSAAAKKTADDFDLLFGGGKARVSAWPGKLSDADIMQVVMDHQMTVRACAAEQKRKNPGVHGVLALRWSVQPSGEVRRVSAETRMLADSPLARCLTRELSAWTFPPHKLPTNGIQFPFRF